MRPAVRSLSLLLSVLLAFLMPILLVGCGGGDTYSVNEGQLAERFLPTERDVDHHPDSLQALTITEEEGKVRYQLERSYQSLTEK